MMGVGPGMMPPGGPMMGPPMDAGGRSTPERKRYRLHQLSRAVLLQACLDAIKDQGAEVHVCQGCCAEVVVFMALCC